MNYRRGNGGDDLIRHIDTDPENFNDENKVRQGKRSFPVGQCLVDSPYTQTVASRKCIAITYLYSSSGKVYVGGAVVRSRKNPPGSPRGNKKDEGEW